MLNLHFKAPQGRAPFQIDRACRKIPACKIWWAFVQYTSSYGQNTSKFLCIFCYFLYFEVLPSSTPQIPLPTIVKSFQDNLFDHKIHTEHILYGYMSRRHQFRQPTFSKFLWTRNWGKKRLWPFKPHHEKIFPNHTCQQPPANNHRLPTTTCQQPPPVNVNVT